MASKTPKISKKILWALGGMWLLIQIFLGCRSHPLGQDWEKENRITKKQKCIAAVHNIFAYKSHFLPHRKPYKENEILFIHPRVLVYRFIKENSPLKILFFRDISMIDSFTHWEIPSHPETLHCYLRKGSLSVKTVQGEIPLLTHLYLARPLLELPYREHGARRKLQAALKYLLLLPISKKDIFWKIKHLVLQWNSGKISQSERDQRIIKLIKTNHLD